MTSPWRWRMVIAGAVDRDGKRWRMLSGDRLGGEKRASCAPDRGSVPELGRVSSDQPWRADAECGRSGGADRRLFALPTAEKLKVKRMPGEFTGYGNGAVVNSETLNEEYYSEAITLACRSSDDAMVSGKLWPEGNPAFSSVCEFAVSLRFPCNNLGFGICTETPA